MSDLEQVPRKSTELDVFVGEWHATGMSYGGADQSEAEPRANGVPWVSEHSAYWYTGEFFLVQDERARPGGATLDMLWILGWDARLNRLFARTFENHGYYRDYDVQHQGDTWVIAGATERATIEFRNGNREQVIAWEWKPNGTWLPLCDRIAIRVDDAPGQTAVGPGARRR
ncbi:MAG: hypothetical protein R3E87_05175 [Burkholderiaceae bacterium]